MSQNPGDFCHRIIGQGVLQSGSSLFPIPNAGSKRQVLRAGNHRSLQKTRRGNRWAIHVKIGPRLYFLLDHLTPTESVKRGTHASSTQQDSTFRRPAVPTPATHGPQGRTIGTTQYCGRLARVYYHRRTSRERPRRGVSPATPTGAVPSGLSRRQRSRLILEGMPQKAEALDAFLLFPLVFGCTCTASSRPSRRPARLVAFRAAGLCLDS